MVYGWWLCMGWRAWAGDVTLSKCTDRFQTGAAIITSIHSFVDTRYQPSHQTTGAPPSIHLYRHSIPAQPSAHRRSLAELAHSHISLRTGNFNGWEVSYKQGHHGCLNHFVLSAVMRKASAALPPPWSPVTKRELFIYGHQSRAGVWTLCWEH